MNTGVNSPFRTFILCPVREREKDRALWRSRLVVPPSLAH